MKGNGTAVGAQFYIVARVEEEGQPFGGAGLFQLHAGIAFLPD